MVFASESQRKGFFSKIKDLKEQHRQKVQAKLQADIEKEQKELKAVQFELKKRQLHAQVENAKREQMVLQKKQIQSLKQQEKEAKKQAFSLTNTGRTINFLKKEAGVAGSGIKRFATSKNTKKVIRKIGKELGL